MVDHDDDRDDHDDGERLSSLGWLQSARRRT
jgi:hypothetical protein